jgi:general stress protein 26
VSRRDQIAMSEQEVANFIDRQRVVVCATIGVRGWPHLVPLWYVVRGDEIWAWTYAASQKTRNLERDDRATLQLEDGVEYQELRGVMVEARTVIHRDTGVVAEIGAAILSRYADTAAGPEVMAAVQAQAAKRVALQFVPERVASWDHRKLAGVY